MSEWIAEEFSSVSGLMMLMDISVGWEAKDNKFPLLLLEAQELEATLIFPDCDG